MVYRIADGHAYVAMTSAPAEPVPPDPRSLRDRWDEDLWPELRAAYDEIVAARLDASDAAEVWDARWAALERLWEIHFVVAFGSHEYKARFNQTYTELLGGDDRDPAALLQGSSATTQRLEADLRALVEVARSGGLDAAVGPFLAEHGHMGQDGSLASAPWDEDPAPLLAEVAKRLEHEPPAVDVRARAEGLIAAARERLAGRPDDLARFDEALAAALRDGSLGEEHATFIDAMLGHRMRKLVIRAGERLVAEGAIESASDVVHLHKDEICEALANPTDLRALVRERADELERWRTVRPPKRLGGRPRSSPAAPSDGVLRGIGASPGKGRGPARIVRSAADFARVEPGDVLVCRSTSPAYTPVMAIASAVVTEAGGLHSHAGVESRELGVPAAVGVPNARELIRDGQTVEVDGDAGTVTPA